MFILILEEFRSPATSSSFSSPDRSQHCSLFRLPLHKSVPSALAAPVGTTNFQSVLLATQHSPLATNSFAIRTSEKPALNSFRMRTSKTQHLKPFRMNTYEKPPRGAPSWLTRNPMKDFCPERLSRASEGPLLRSDDGSCPEEPQDEGCLSSHATDDLFGLPRTAATRYADRQLLSGSVCSPTSHWSLAPARSFVDRLAASPI